MNEEEHFILNIPDNYEHNIKSGGLDFLPSNFENSTISNETNVNNNNERVINFDNLEETKVRHRGNVGNYLEKYGVGWLLDQNNSAIESEDSLPLLEELDIDLTGIKYKLKCVIMPLADDQNLNRSVLRDDPDFWGPLFIVLLFSLISVYGQFKVISWILTIWIMGSFIIFVIARALGGEVSYSQIVGTIGYSLLPLLTMACITPFFKSYHYLSSFLKLIGLAWSTYSAATILCVQEIQHKKPLLLYPIFLLYIYFLSLYSGV